VLRIKRTLSFLFWSILFGVAYTQAPLYYSNQNQYFLHGLAHGLGNLNQDWLANTIDPTPVFSYVVGLTFHQQIQTPDLQYVHENLFYLYYILILGLYFHSLVGIGRFCEPALNGKPLARLGFITLFVAIHAGILRLASATLFGVDYPWYFQAGVAGQYVLGFGLQPSVFGVFLLASINAFLRNRPWLAATLACLAGIVHSTYLLGAAMLILAYQILLLKDKQIKKAILLGLWALVLVLPVVIYNAIAFAPTSPEIFAEAQRILAHFRIPHHAEVGRWLDGIAIAQVVWIVLSTLLIRKTKLCLIMIIVFALSLILTLIQVATDNDTLALLFPWRTSAVLVPLGTSIILARFVGCLSVSRNSVVEPEIPLTSPLARRLTLGQITCWTMLGVLFGGGLAISYFELGYPTNPDELPLLQYARSWAGNGQIYLLPVEWPRLDTGKRGAASTNFTRAPRAGESGHLISIDLQRFRIFTRKRLFVDFKSIPYQDVEVVEWHRRLLWAHKLYADHDWNDKKTLESLRSNGINYVISTGKRPIAGPKWKKVYEDPKNPNYRIYSFTQ
jgi:hypothetical protein